MEIRISYDAQFDSLMETLRNKYPAKLFDLEGIGQQLDFNEYSRAFFESAASVADQAVDSNANVDGKDVITFNHERTKPFGRLNSMYLLWKYLKRQEGRAYADEAIEAQLSGDIYINDFWDFGRPYCFNFSTYDIATQGLPMVSKVKCVPPRYLLSFKSQVEQFLGIASNSILGATGLADLLIVMGWYLDQLRETNTDAHINMPFHEGVCNYVRELITSLIYTLNQPMFRGNQSPFTNISIFDDYFLDELLPKYEIDGRIPSKTAVKWAQDVFLECMNREMARTPITFPVVTACFSIDENGDIKDQEFLNKIVEANHLYGFINIYCGKSSTLSSCCRLRSDTVSEYFNSFGAGSTKIGSLGVVTLNLPRLAFRAVRTLGPGKAASEWFLQELERYAIMAPKINNAKRALIKRRIDAGAMPLYSWGFMELSRQYSTTGLTGIYEALETLGYDILTEEGQEFVEELLAVVHAANAVAEETFKAPHNIEQVPAESSAVKLAAKDALLGYGSGKYLLYSNQFLPLTAPADLLQRIELQGRFDRLFSGGAICHLNLAERCESTAMRLLIQYAARQGVIYFAVNYALNMCAEGHMTVGHNASACSICGQPITDTFTRVVGFLTNTKHWNKVRREIEWPARVFV